MKESELDLEHSFDSATLIHDIRKILKSATESRADWIQEVNSLIHRIDEILKHTPAAHVPMEWRVIVAGLRVMASQGICVAIARGGEGDLIAERTRYDVLVDELQRHVSSDSLALTNNANSACQLLIQKAQFSRDELCAFLLMIPLPTLYWHTRELEIPCQDLAEKPDIASTPMLRVIVFLDHDPIASPQLLTASILYPLVFKVRGLIWPVGGERLRLDLLTTCPQNEFSVSEFALEKPPCIENGEYEGILEGQIKFNTGQSTLLDDLVFTVRGAFETSDGDIMETSVIGHNELRLRIVDENRHPLMTGNRRLDRHIVELVTKLVSDFPRVRNELTNLLEMLEALARLLATYAQEAIYKGRNDVSESEFLSNVLRDLRNVLGQDVQEHPSQAGGVVDIRYRGVIVELKVEKENGDRERISKKYSGQTVQYTGIEARQVSVVLVLDLTSKDKPPGDIRNDIILTDVDTHGGDDRSKEFPSKAFIFIINGNMKDPSTYSR